MLSCLGVRKGGGGEAVDGGGEMREGAMFKAQILLNHNRVCDSFVVSTPW